MSIFAAMNKATKDAHERDVRAGKAVAEPEGQHPLVRFYKEPLEEIPTGPVDPPKIRAFRDEPVRRGSPRRSTRTTRKSVDRDQSVDSEMRRTPTPTPSEGSILYRMFQVNCRICREASNTCVSQRNRITYETKSRKDTEITCQETCQV